MKKYLKKTVALAAATALCAGALGGCGSAKNSTETSSQADTTAAESSTITTTEAQAGGTNSETADAESEEGIAQTDQFAGRTLNVTMALSDDEWKAMNNVVLPEFEKLTGCTVKASQVEASDVEKQLQAMHNANNMKIDVISQDVGNMNGLVNAGLVEDLSDYADIVPDTAIGKLSEAGVFDGKIYFLPYRPNAEINYYNTDMFDKYGVKAPTNWDELYDVAKTLKEKDGIGRLCLKLKMDGDAIELAEFIREAGGDPLVLNDEGCVEAFTFLQKLWPELSENTLTAGFSSVNQYLATDEVYYAPNWPFTASVVVKDGGKTNIAASKGYEGPAGYVKTLGGEMLGIPVGSQNKDLAIEYIKYMESKKVQETLMNENGWMSFRSDVYQDVADWQKPFVEVTQQALAAAEPLPHVKYWRDAQQLINDCAKEITVNQADVKTTLDQYATKMQELKEKNQ